MSTDSFHYFRKKVNFKVLTYQDWIERGLKVVSFILTAMAAVGIIYEHGYFTTPIQEHAISITVMTAYIFFMAKFLIRAIISTQFFTYIKNNKFELVCLLFILGSYIATKIIEYNTCEAELTHVRHRHTLLYHGLFLIILCIELAKFSGIFKKIKLSPPLLMLLSFFILIAAGTLLLMMPKMTTHGITFIDALFTATSASCVTGLSVVVTGTTFTFNGQVVILLLIQLGGMSILSFATFFISFLSHSFTGLKYKYLVKDMLATEKVSDSYFFLREIVLTIIITEAAGIAMLYLYWKTTGLFESDHTTLFYAAFHAISAFNNAGFSLWPDNFMDSAVVDHYFPQAILMILVFLGGIGFVVLRDFFDPKVIRERKQKRWQRLMPGTQIVLITSFVIIAVGTLCFFILEYDNTLADKETVFDKFFFAFSQIMLGRTAGINILDMEQMSLPMTMIFIMILFIGASPGSTGGGIKTTTAFVIVKSIFATIKGKNKIEFRKKTIPFHLVDKAFSIVVMSFVIIFISVIILTILEPTTPLKNILFETTSAFTTCGLSTDCISTFSPMGKAVLTFNMYIGRIGTLTFAYALSKRTKESRHEYPETNFMVG